MELRIKRQIYPRFFTFCPTSFPLLFFAYQLSLSLLSFLRVASAITSLPSLSLSRTWIFFFSLKYYTYISWPHGFIFDKSFYYFYFLNYSNFFTPYLNHQFFNFFIFKFIILGRVLDSDIKRHGRITKLQVLET